MKIKFVKRVHACFAGASSNDTVLEREMDLSFIPQVGMNFGYETVLEVYVDWDGTVTVYVEADKTFYERGLNSGDPLFTNYNGDAEFKELVAHYVEQGWNARKGI